MCGARLLTSLLPVLVGVPLAVASAFNPLGHELLLQAQVQRLPMQEQAKRAREQPMKLGLHLLTEGARVGDKVPVEVALLDGNNQPASWNRLCQIELGVSGPSGKTEEHKITIPSGQTAAQYTFIAREIGLLNLKARETSDILLPGGNSILIGPSQAKKSNKAKKRIARLSGSPYVSTVGSTLASQSYLLVGLLSAQTSDQGTAPTPGEPSSPEMLLTNSTGRDEILADGKDFARIKIDYMDPQGDPAPSNIKVWLTWSNGKLDPQPLIIKRGQSSAEAQWTSLSPVDATVSLVSSAPKYSIRGTSALKVSFVPAIYGIAPASPNPLKLTLIDCVPLVTQFFDQDGRTIQTAKSRRITFTSTNPALHIDPAYRDVSPNDSAASIFLLPTWRGSAQIDIWTPGYSHQTIVVEVTMWLVLVLCLGGGIVGGIAAKGALKASVAWRIFVGILGAIVLVWINVYAVLPQTHSIIAHNLVSVFVVGILGGYGGTHILDYGGKKLGYL